MTQASDSAVIEIQPYIDSQINKYWQDMNLLLQEKFNNQLALFDFTWVSHRPDGLIDVKSFFRYANKRYPDILGEFFERKQFSLKSDEGLETSLFNICEDGTIDYPEGKTSYYLPAAPIDIHKDIISVTFSAWHNFLKEKAYCGASFIVFNKINLSNFNDGSPRDEIEIGIYLILRNPIPGYDNESSEFQDSEDGRKGERLFNYLQTELYRFLIQHGQKIAIQKYLTEVAALEYQKAQQEREIILQIGLAHYIKNSMTGLAKYESEIIEFIRENPVRNDKILLISKAQKLTYRIIQLYLQVRQSAKAGLIGQNNNDDNENIVKYNVVLTDLLLLTYTHSLFLKGIMIKTFNNAVDMNVFIDYLDQNTDKIIEALNSESIIALANSSFEFKLTESQRLTILNIERQAHLSLDKFSDQINLLLSKDEWKQYYTAFLEIFDNIYGEKHKMGYAQFFHASTEKHLIIRIISYNTKGREFILEDELNELTEEFLSEGLGLRIIRACFEKGGASFRFSRDVREVMVGPQKQRSFSYEIVIPISKLL